MKKELLKPFVLVGCLIAVTCVAMAYSNREHSSGVAVAPVIGVPQGVVSVNAKLVQDKIFAGGDGTVSLALTLSADAISDDQSDVTQNVDMVFVLDRSGSMQGQKLRDARSAVLKLLYRLSDKDRFGMVSYANGVIKHTALVNVTAYERKRLEAVIRGINAGGGTNLGAGLQTGINVLLTARNNGNIGKVLLISDGLANQGVTDPFALGNMASLAVEKAFAIIKVRVGNDFNEQPMTKLADRGAGSYHYMENPNAFAGIFEKEFNHTRMVAAGAVAIEVPLANGVTLVNASGFPIEQRDGYAVFHPGDIQAGQSRKLFLTFKVPTNRERKFELNGIRVRYLHKDRTYIAALSEPLHIACVKDKKAVISSIKPQVWEKKVLQDDYNKLVEEVAADVKRGNEQDALKKINHYKNEQELANRVIKSPRVAANLDKDVGALKEMVTETFKGDRQTVELKQKRNAKALQYEGYLKRRAK